MSALSNYPVMLDQFFDRELFPRFEKARTLKEASVSRKIGALRESITSAIESNLDRAKRTDSKSTINLSDLESTLRIVTGAVGEQHTVLSRAFYEFGEKPNAVLDLVADQAVLWTHIGPTTRISSLQLSKIIHNVIWQLVQRAVEQLRTTGNHAIDSLQQIAKELGKTDAPTRGEFEMLLREMPRFELATLPEEITVGRWKILGDRIVRSRIQHGLQESIGSLLKRELHLYGSALSQWGEQIVRKLETLVNSYGDAYRVQIHQISGSSDEVVDVGQLQSDLELLKSWNATSMAEFAEKRA